MADHMRHFPVTAELDAYKVELRAFVKESNRIEGITRAVSRMETAALRRLLESTTITTGTVLEFVGALNYGFDNCRLRNESGMDVVVGGYRPPLGGPEVVEHLRHLLLYAMEGGDPYDIHQAYEKLHPLTDGNGRSGRAIWLWQMLHQHNDLHALRRGFMYTWYLQSFQGSRR